MHKVANESKKMHKVGSDFLIQLGKLVKKHRSGLMSQDELANRIGVSRKTISAIERGIGVNSKALVDVLSFLQLLPYLAEVVEQRLDMVGNGPERKLRKPKQELPNDF